MYPLVILDRDGVINEDSSEYIKSVDEWIPIPGSLEAMAALTQARVKVAIATNQSGVSRGYYSEATLHAMHNKMMKLLAELGGKVDYLAYCIDLPDSGSTRRKPEPGMLFEISRALNIPLGKAVFVGDTFSDYQAAQSAGCGFILVLSGKGKNTLVNHPELVDNASVFANLRQAIQHILGNI